MGDYKTDIGRVKSHINVVLGLEFEEIIKTLILN